MKKPVFTGAAVAIITPFKSTGEVDYEEFGKIIDHQIAHGTDAIVVCGTTGEASALHDKEHREALAWCCEYVNHRVPVVAGTGSNDTAYAIELTKFAAECGADAGLSVTPYYNKTTQRGLIAHYTAIAQRKQKYRRSCTTYRAVPAFPSPPIPCMSCLSTRISTASRLLPATSRCWLKPWRSAATT